MDDLVTEYKRLRGHVGFTGGALDPVFLQDKLLYLMALDKDDRLPTLRITMPMLDDNDDVVIAVEDILNMER
jgi:hypothetical protein